MKQSFFKSFIASTIILLILISFASCGQNGLQDPPFDSGAVDLYSNGTDAKSKEFEFVKAIYDTLLECDIKGFSGLVDNSRLTVIGIYSGMGVVEFVSKRNIEDTQIIDGILFTKNDLEVDPPVQEIGISAAFFSEEKPSYKLFKKEGLLEHIDWANIDYDYLAAHFHAFYDHMLWMCVNESEEDGWVIYELANDTYLYSNNYSWYSESWQARVLVGKTFVVKRINNEYKIVAFIDLK